MDRRATKPGCLETQLPGVALGLCFISSLLRGCEDKGGETCSLLASVGFFVFLQP